MKEIMIDGKKYVEAEEKTLKQYSIIRTYSAGVHFGIVVRRDGKEVTLRDARRIWYWDGAASLSQMALEGVKKPENCKFSVSIPEILLTEAIEVIPCTDKARESIFNVRDWRRD